MLDLVSMNRPPNVLVEYDVCVTHYNYKILCNILQYKFQFHNQMTEYGITKIIDGIFISDPYVPKDFSFLLGNKVCRVLGWTIFPHRNQGQQFGINEKHLCKNPEQIKLPSFSEIKEAFEFLDEAHDECLCGLIYSQSMCQSAIVAIMYLMQRYNWDLQTGLAYVKLKVKQLEVASDTIEQLEEFEKELIKKNLSSNPSFIKELKYVEFNSGFLQNYSSEDSNQLLLINTMKNMMNKHNQLDQNSTKNKKKKKRIQWKDMTRPSSALILSSKNISKSFKKVTTLTANNSRTQLVEGFSKENVKQQEFNNYVINKSINKSTSEKKLERCEQGKEKQKKQLNLNLIEDDLEFLQLKDMSRTNFNDKKFMSNKNMKRSSLKKIYKNKDKTQAIKPFEDKTNQVQQESFSSYTFGKYSCKKLENPSKRPLSGKKNLYLSYKGLNTQKFLDNMRTYNKNQFTGTF